MLKKIKDFLWSVIYDHHLTDWDIMKKAKDLLKEIEEEEANAKVD